MPHGERIGKCLPPRPVVVTFERAREDLAVLACVRPSRRPVPLSLLFATTLPYLLGGDQRYAAREYHHKWHGYDNQGCKPDISSIHAFLHLARLRRRHARWVTARWRCCWRSSGIRLSLMIILWWAGVVSHHHAFPDCQPLRLFGQPICPRASNMAKAKRGGPHYFLLFSDPPVRRGSLVRLPHL